VFSRMWHFPGCGTLQDLFFPLIWQYTGLGLLQDVTFSKEVPGFVPSQDVGLSRTCTFPGCCLFQEGVVSRTWPFPGCCLFQDVAVSRIWQRPGIFLSQDVAFRVTRIWPHRTFGPRADGRGSVTAGAKSRNRSVAASAKSWRPR